MSKKVIITSESACDLTSAQCEAAGIRIIPYHIHLDGREYLDGVELQADEIFRTYREKRVLPSTAAINVQDFTDFFTPMLDLGYEVVHISLSGMLSSSFQNSRAAAESLPGVYPVDSFNFSAGVGTLAVYASPMAARGMSGKEIQRACEGLRARVHGSCVIDTLTFLAAGGRCSSIAAFGANLLQLKPCIEADTKTGALRLGKKYRGNMTSIIPKYFTDFAGRFTDVETDFIYITHAGSSEEEIALAREALLRVHPYREIIVMRAGCTISTHCGPRTIGCFVVTKA